MIASSFFLLSCEVVLMGVLGRVVIEASFFYLATATGLKVKHVYVQRLRGFFELFKWTDCQCKLFIIVDFVCEVWAYAFCLISVHVTSVIITNFESIWGAAKAISHRVIKYSAALMARIFFFFLSNILV